MGMDLRKGFGSVWCYLVHWNSWSTFKNLYFFIKSIDPDYIRALSSNPTRLSNTVKQFVRNYHHPFPNTMLNYKGGISEITLKIIEIYLPSRYTTSFQRLYDVV